ncbi:GntR family transcriptional regulator [Hydrogenophaga sp. SL48]|uniref:GntR family transcriptional regulator n=1 Tax=Hydrogenophaga sp. SL48 TaxID=2806347 RepID=UPI001F38546D|nr:FCD domain-containing protein [Hydrogenophaga sp. SL48]UJW83146.1 GntR family transcriptional regulator [Hydrogenophaga sp. SL48]
MNMLARQILEAVLDQGLAEGAHLTAAALAGRLKVSRTPVSQALVRLQEKGVVVHEPNRGFFLAASLDRVARLLATEFQVSQTDSLSAAYFQLAEDRLNGVLPDEVTEADLRSRYSLSGGQLHTLLHRIADEGWMQKRPGYGWDFSAILTTPGSLLKSYRLRLALEPAALLEPGYHLDPQVIARLRATERRLLNGGIETATPEELHDRGVLFHEALVQASGNAFFIDAVRRVHRLRRLLSYRSMKDRVRYAAHCQQHLDILDLIEAERLMDASAAMSEHLNATIRNLEKIRALLGPEVTPQPRQAERSIPRRSAPLRGA